LDPFQLGKVIDEKLGTHLREGESAAQSESEAGKPGCAYPGENPSQLAKWLWKSRSVKKSQTRLSTELANGAKSARFALSHSRDGGGYSVTFPMSRRSTQGHIFKWLDAPGR
jgi:hypothetical protein